MRNLPFFFQSLFTNWIFYTGGVLTMTPFVERWFRNPWLTGPLRHFDSVRSFSVRHIKDLRWIGVILVFVACYQAWKVEHDNYDAAINGPDGKVATWNKFNQCDSERSALQKLSDTYAAQLANQQGTINSCVVSLGKLNIAEPTKITTSWALLVTKANGADSDYGVVLIDTNKALPHINGTLRCRKFFKLVNFSWTGTVRIAQTQNHINADGSVQLTISVPWNPKDHVVLFISGNDLVSRDALSLKARLHLGFLP